MMHPRFALILGTLGVATALIAAPFGVQVDTALLYGKAALAAGNGNGNGHGHGKGRGNGQGQADGLTASESRPGKSGSAPGHGGLGNGQAFGNDAVSGVESLSEHQKGNLNGPLHASPKNHASANSIIGRVDQAITDAYVDSGDDDAVIGLNDVNEIELRDALEQISNHTVAEGTTGAVVDNAAVPEPQP